MKKITVPVILGPTAVGKTQLALELAARFGYEIISCDSRQIYRHMDIGTAKPGTDQLDNVVHWFVNIINPDQSYSAHHFAQKALKIIREKDSCGKKVLICGGTGLYFYTLSRGIGVREESDTQIRTGLQQRVATEGAQALYDELSRIDPQSASKLHPNDLQRIIRALEVFYKSGKPLSLLQEISNPPSDIDFVTCIVTCSRDILYHRINLRVDGMMSAGLFDEFRLLQALGFNHNSPGMQCVGYRELFAVQRRELNLSDAIEKIKQNTRNYAKRQFTWFRNKSKGTHLDSEQAYSKLKKIFSQQQR